MQASVYQYLQQNPRLANFVRYNPEWYRYLSRNPYSLYEMEKEAKKFYGKTIPQQVEKIGNQVQMVNMLVQFAGAMKD
ncbi:YlbE-like family protein [Virgibacillus doumboii]|uniref:YlbE-like family protein n=1 Tax=Virgibacillus doumboii TaxID=2697503 RepID=UPI0013DF002D|nr:YlbE-like family protein [Virgibacillus doumboii]